LGAAAPTGDNYEQQIVNRKSKIPDLWSGVHVTQINIVSQNAAKFFFFSYQAVLFYVLVICILNFDIV
jgi:hypothetical protein